MGGRRHFSRLLAHILRILGNNTQTQTHIPSILWGKKGDKLCNFSTLRLRSKSDTHSSLCYLTLISIHFLKRISLHRGDFPNEIQVDSNYSHDAAASCGSSILLMVSKWFMFSKFIITAVLPNREGQVNSLPTETAHGWLHNFSLSLFKVICVVVGWLVGWLGSPLCFVSPLLLLSLFAAVIFNKLLIMEPLIFYWEWSASLALRINIVNCIQTRVILD